MTNVVLVGEPIGLELRTTGRHEYRHVQLFTGFMYIGATVCAIFLRQWKLSTVRGKREARKETSDSPALQEFSIPKHGRFVSLMAWLEIQRV